ncbi:MAG: two-component regulator propeller domain-containing protein [Candidatus Eisenbacteria bacterium]
MRRWRGFIPALLILALALPAGAEDVWEAHVTQKNGRAVAREGDTVFLASGGGVLVHDVRTERDTLLLPVHGLASVDVTSVAVDGSGNKWFAHGDPELGISVLSADGEWSLVSSFEGLQLGTGKRVNTVYALGDSVWVGTESGATLFIDRHREFIVSQEKEGIVSDNINAIVSVEGKVWFATDQGLSRFSRAAVRNYTVESDALPSPEVLCLAADRRGRIWAGTGIGFFVVEENEVTVPAGLEILQNRRIRSIAFEDSAGVDVPWFATSDGPYRRSVRRVARDTGGSIIEPEEVTQVYVDLTGNIWVSSNVRSLFRWVPSVVAWHEYYRTNTIQENFIADIALDEKGIAWCPMVGNRELVQSPGRRFTAYNGLSWTTVTASVLGSDYALITSVAIDSSGHRWFGVARAAAGARTLIKIDQASGSAVSAASVTIFEIRAANFAENQRAVFNVEVAPDNSKWVAVTKEGFAALGPLENEDDWAGFSSESRCLSSEGTGPTATDLTFGADGRVWGAFERNRAVVIDYKGTLTDRSDDECTVLTESNSEIPSNALYTVRADPRGRIWFGTQGGLSMYDPSSDSWNVYTSAASAGGLRDNRCRAIAFDGRGNTWIGTFGGGLSVLLPDGETWLEPWTVADNQRRGSGITSDQIMSLFIRTNPETEEEEVWIATWGGGVIRLVVDWTAVDPETPGGAGERPPVVAYPNPYREGEYASSVEGVYFLYVPDRATIEIYTLTGEFVKSVDGPISGTDPRYLWDLKNENRVPIASGVYLFLVKENGDVMDRGKIAYLR